MILMKEFYIFYTFWHYLGWHLHELNLLYYLWYRWTEIRIPCNKVKNLGVEPKRSMLEFQRSNRLRYTNFNYALIFCILIIIVVCFINSFKLLKKFIIYWFILKLLFSIKITTVEQSNTSIVFVSVRIKF